MQNKTKCSNTTDFLKLNIELVDNFSSKILSKINSKLILRKKNIRLKIRGKMRRKKIKLKVKLNFHQK
jgi:hypothetical protein